MMLGDLNCDFLRRTDHVMEICRFLEISNLYTLWRDYEVDFTHMSESPEGGCYSSTIDHIVALKRSNVKIREAGVIHHVKNLSDHEPIYAVISIIISRM